jgi:hypothetical protein
VSSPRLPPEALIGLGSLAEERALGDLDLSLVGDGSGTVCDGPAGWACVAYDRRQRQAVVHAGSATGGTDNFAGAAGERIRRYSAEFRVI